MSEKDRRHGLGIASSSESRPPVSCRIFTSCSLPITRPRPRFVKRAVSLLTIPYGCFYYYFLYYVPSYQLCRLWRSGFSLRTSRDTSTTSCTYRFCSNHFETVNGLKRLPVSILALRPIGSSAQPCKRRSIHSFWSTASLSFNCILRRLLGRRLSGISP
jgi:hypothetical protein